MHCGHKSENFAHKFFYIRVNLLWFCFRELSYDSSFALDVVNFARHYEWHSILIYMESTIRCISAPGTGAGQVDLDNTRWVSVFKYCSTNTAPIATILTVSERGKDFLQIDVRFYGKGLGFL